MTDAERIEDLVRMHLYEVLDDSQARELADLLNASREARRIYVRETRLYAALSINFRGVRVADPVPAEAPRRRISSARRAVRQKHSGFALYLALACGVLLLVGTWILLPGKPSPRDPVAKRPAAPNAAQAGPEDAVRTHPARPMAKETPLQAVSPAAEGPVPAPPPVPRRESITESLIPAIPTLPGTAETTDQTPPKPRIQVPAPDLPTAGQVTPRSIARIGTIEGLVMYARGEQGQWVKAVKGIPLLAGDKLDTRNGRVGLQLDGGSTAYADRRSRLRLLTAVTAEGEAVLVSLTRGEVFVVDAGGKRVNVETPEGLVSPVGTRFLVSRRLSTTIVTVDAGAVEVRSVPGERNSDPARAARVDLRRVMGRSRPVRVAAGRQTRMRPGQAPTAPRSVSLLRLVWLRRLAPELYFAGRMLGPLRYDWRGTRAGDGDGRTLPGWTYPLGNAWTFTTASATRAGIDVRRWQPAKPAATRSHAVVGQASWRDYEVVLAFRVLPGSMATESHSVSAIAYQGARPRDLYRLTVGRFDERRGYIGFHRHWDAMTTIHRKIASPIPIQAGVWYRMRYAVRTRKESTHMWGKVWSAARQEPSAWTIEFEDRAPDRLTAGAAGAGLDKMEAEIAEFSVHDLVAR